MTNKHFLMRVGPGKDYRLIVFSMDAERPENYFDRVEKDLSKKKFSGVLLLDLLACNGSLTKRFASVVFDGCKLKLETVKLKKPSEIDERTTSFCTEFYVKHKKALDQSVISFGARQFIRDAELDQAVTG